MSLKIFFYIIFILFSRLTVAQQISHFSEDPAKFISEFSVFMKKSNRPSAINAAGDMESFWNSNDLKIHQKKIIIALSQSMLDKKMKAFPQFEDFVMSLYYAYNRKMLNDKFFNEYASTLKKILENETPKAFHNFVITCKNLFYRSALYSTNYHTWYIKGGNYSFEYISEKLPSAIEQSLDIKSPEQDTTPKLDVNSDEYWNDSNEWNESGWGSKEDEQWGQAEQNYYESFVEEEMFASTGAKINFDKMDLVIKTRHDSTQITGTSGSYFAINNSFKGTGGKFNWTCVQLLPEVVHADLKNYYLFTNKPEFKADSVTLTFPEVSDKPILGNLIFKSQKRQNQEMAVYPFFQSIINDVQVKNIGNNLRYKGGFSLRGRTKVGSSTEGKFSTLEIGPKAKPLVIAYGKAFSIFDTAVISNKSGVTFFHHNDSVYHPGVIFKYNKKNNKVILVKQNKGLGHSPFIDSYHKMEIDVEAVYYDLDEPKIDFTLLTGKSEAEAKFESTERYYKRTYEGLQGTYNFHPLQLALNVAKKNKSDTIFDIDIAESNKINIKLIKGAMATLYNEGFIDYNGVSGRVILFSKARHWVESNFKKSDYDNIMMRSTIEGEPNATLDLATQELIIRGCKPFYLSDSQKVFVEPKGKELTIEKNRSVNFSGKIKAGRFEFYGDDFKFNYDSFAVKLNNIDSLRFLVPTSEKDKKGKSREKYVGSTLSDLSGTLFLDQPKNKSGNKKNPSYPKFNSESESYVYYDKPSIFNGIYDRTRFFHKLNPFKVDSLKSFDVRSISFNGEFHSGGIFPVIKQDLKVMPDNSLGFDYVTPQEGLDAYIDKGKYFEKISLSNQGLRGKGTVKYLSSLGKSQDFVFFFDSVNTLGTQWELPAGPYAKVTYPKASVTNYKMHWATQKDSMYISSTDAPMFLYDENTIWKGDIVLTPGGLYGDGLLDIAGAEVKSHYFKFAQNSFNADSSDFKIKSENPEKPALVSLNAMLNFDIAGKNADFKSISKGAATSFPFVQYKTSLRHGNWDIARQTVSMKKPPDAKISDAYFYSTKKDQDSLVYNATNALYDIKQQNLNVSGIPYIRVADAFIRPDSNEVTVRENAAMDPLLNARVEADTLNKYHHLINSQLNILSRKKFQGQGIVEFKNSGGGKTNLTFNDFSLEEGHTRAKSDIPEEQKFQITPRIQFKGGATLNAENKFMYFNGHVSVMLARAPTAEGPRWIRYKETVNPDSLYIKINREVAGDLVTGIHFDQDSLNLYNTFLSPKKLEKHDDIFNAEGLLYFDNKKNNFVIGDKDKILYNSLEGNLLKYDEQANRIDFEGKMNFLHRTKDMNLYASGTGAIKKNENDYVFNTFLVFEFKFPGDALKLMGDSVFNQTRLGRSEAHPQKNQLALQLASFIGDKKTQKYLKTLESEKPDMVVDLSSDFKNNIVISDAELRWSEEHNAYYSVGELGVSNILNKPIDKKIKGLIEIRKGKIRSGPFEGVTLYLEVNPELWYYIDFSTRTLGCVSSDQMFNDEVRKKDNTEKQDPDDYAFQLVDVSEKTIWFTKARTKYRRR
ncbi:MAG: hypothetical protein A3H98_00960 [Bacteroidetes bacterium RIFCSPLOWO2_02_FULL_36_8]|nr:MAG: hypothetical protein A3H98_00960 [Bacteroidetes bacterium RIFCSPLOWO2_02_FULL_36_8]